MTPHPHKSSARWQFWIDRGGTFTDIVAQRPDGTLILHKLLSENPHRYQDAPIQGIRDLMSLPAQAPLPAADIASIKMGTTVATNALLERKGDRTLFITTAGFRDGLRIGYQNRPDIFAQQIVLPEMLYEKVVEVPERVTATGKVLKAITPAVIEQIRSELMQAYADGIGSCAIAFLHSYQYPAHEQQIGQLAEQVGFTQVSLSHQVSPLIKWVSRGDTTVVDSYLSPILKRYVDRIEKAFAVDDINNDEKPQLLFMQSNGGLTPASYFRGKDSILSGPAGGIVGAVQSSLAAGFKKIITFDMGGTSTDVAHYKSAENHEDSESLQNSPTSSPIYERTFETEVAGVRLRSPMMAIHTVAAGGGSALSFQSDRYQVGPDSAGAYPGPACYRSGGPLTVTDCNVMVGKIHPDLFPKVFGPDGNQPLDNSLVQTKFTELANTINTATGDGRSPEQVAEGFLAIAIDNMASAIKKISVQKGYDIADYTLCCFGAAGGQHACKLAESLGIKTIFIHPFAGVLSAYGMGLADRRVLKEKTAEVPLTDDTLPQLREQLNNLSALAEAHLQAQGTQDISHIETVPHLHVRYTGTDATLPVDLAPLEDIQTQFETRYRQRYGITLPDTALIVATITTEAIGKPHHPEEHLPTEKSQKESSSAHSADKPIATKTVLLFSEDQWHSVPVYNREHLPIDIPITGPAILLEKTGTNILESGWSAVLKSSGAIVLRQQATVEKDVRSPVSLSNPDPVRLEIFNNLFQAIAEQMGLTLQNTSSSVNIKERLDFSCAIFDRQGELVANAPHIPVHLGSMGESVKALIASNHTPFKPGDTFISNNPFNGGTHLPDITAITPVFIPTPSIQSSQTAPSSTQPLFFVASRGHHADIGGITPGSMPPGSTHLSQEGILLDNIRLVTQGTLQASQLKTLLTNHPHPARNPAQNLADLQAQIAANNKGVQELHRMVTKFGLPTVQAYMQHVQNNAEESVRQAIAQLYSQHGPTPMTCTVPMDCGATIQVNITLSPTSRSADIDFTGTSPQQPNNFNAPLAICKAAILYVFRTLVERPIPLNAGCLKPLNILVPAGSLLNPSYPAAVVAGNVETSQAITDALYGALGVQAASQGTMNNFTFGNTRYQYYETICGGSGAGNSFPGTDAVQTHMTNSRLTDPEVLEVRFPVLLNEFCIRQGSGGHGRYPGGHGVVRDLSFLEQMTANILSGRRKTQPFGLEGGQPGASGQTQVVRGNGESSFLPATSSVAMNPGDRIIISTPGGGGYGAAPDLL